MEVTFLRLLVGELNSQRVYMQLRPCLYEQKHPTFYCTSIRVLYSLLHNYKCFLQLIPQSWVFRTVYCTIIRVSYSLLHNYKCFLQLIPQSWMFRIVYCTSIRVLYSLLHNYKCFVQLIPQLWLFRTVYCTIIRVSCNLLHNYKCFLQFIATSTANHCSLSVTILRQPAVKNNTMSLIKLLSPIFKQYRLDVKC